MDRIRKFEPIFGEWYAESFIGAGSFGRVYKIYREELGNRFYSALKYISLPAESGEIAQLRFDGMDDASISTYYTDLAKDISSEITLMNKLRGNSNIVSFEDSKVIPKPDGMGYDIFIRMELLESLTSKTTNSVTSPDETVKIGLDICNALVRCQKNNIIHRDIKPDNIFVSEDGDYKLGDFGVARKLEKAATFMSKKGTYNYMAPEVYKGERYGAACDIYSLGLVMYRMLNRGRLPFLPPAPAPILTSDREGALLRRMGGEPLPAPCEADPELAAIVLKACEFRETDRYASAADMRKALQNYSLRRGDSPAPQPKEERDPYEATGGAYNSVPAPTVKPEPRTAYEATGGTFGSSAAPSPAPAVHESVKENSCDATSGVFGAAAAAAAPQQRANDYDATSGVFSSSVKNEKAPEPEEYSFDPDATQALSSTRNRRPEPKKAEPPAVKPIEPAAPVQPVQPVQPVKAGAGGKKKKTGLIIGIAAAAVAMTVGVLAIAGVFGGKKNTTTDASAANTEGNAGAIDLPTDLPVVKPGSITPEPTAAVTSKPTSYPDPTAIPGAQTTPVPTASADQKAAEKIEQLISKIGTVNALSYSTIQEAREAFDKASSSVKGNVKNYSTLTTAESVYRNLIRANGKAALDSFKVEINNSTTWYSPTYGPKYIDSNSYVLPYLGVRENGTVVTREIFDYVGNKALKAYTVNIYIDGVFDHMEVADWGFESGYGSGSGKYYEYLDEGYFWFEDEAEQLYYDIGNSNTTVVKFVGNSGSYDYTLTSEEKQAFLDVLYAYLYLKLGYGS